MKHAALMLYILACALATCQSLFAETKLTRPKDRVEKPQPQFEPQSPRVLAPPASGVTIGVNHMLGLVHPVSDLEQNGVPPGWTTFFALEPSLGYRFSHKTGYLEFGIPVSVYNFYRAGLGVSLMWRFKAFPALGLGLQVSYVPKQYIQVELPRLMLICRTSDASEIFFHLVGLYVIFEPGRDISGEEGFESKAPFWGCLFGAGLRWTIPAG